MATDLPSSEFVSDSTSLLAQMRPSLVRYFQRKTGSTTEAEDLTQDVLLRSLTHAQWKSVEEAKGYVFRSAVNRWRERYRKSHGQMRAVEWDEDVEEHLGSENPPERILIVREELDAIFQTMEEMNERTRAVLILVNVEQMKVAAVAEMLGISVRAVSKHLSKGIELLIRQRKRQEWKR